MAKISKTPIILSQYWFENAHPSELIFNDFVVKFKCGGCQKSKKLVLNYFLRACAKLYSKIDLDPPISNPEICINETLSSTSSNRRKTYIIVYVDSDSVLNIINDLKEKNGLEKSARLRCANCWIREMMLGRNDLENELLNCDCLRRNYVKRKDINIEWLDDDDLRACKKDDNMEAILSKNNEFLKKYYSSL